MDCEEVIKKCIEALQSLPEMEYIREMMSKTVESAEDSALHKAEKDTAEEGGKPAPEEKPKEEEVPDGGDELDEPKLKMQFDQVKRRYSKLENEYKLLFSKVEGMERTARVAERRSDLIQLEAEGINFDMVEEMEIVQDLPLDKYSRHLSMMRKRYQKAPIGSKVKPMALPLDGGLPESPTLSPADVYAKIGTPVQKMRD